MSVLLQQTHIDRELLLKLEARRSKVDSRGKEFENQPSISVSDRTADDHKLKTSKTAPSLSASASSQPSLQKEKSNKTIGEKAKGGLSALGSFNLEDQSKVVTVDATENTATWKPLMKKPLPHCLQTNDFGFLGSEDGWKIKMYPTGEKGGSAKCVVNITGPATTPCKITIFCGNQLQIPRDFTGELQMEYDNRHMEDADLTVTVKAQIIQKKAR